MLLITSPEQVQEIDAGARAYQILLDDNQRLAGWLWENTARAVPINVIYQRFIWQWPGLLPEQAYYAVYLSLEFLALAQRNRYEPKH